jgi:23S rRNA (uracil1939-C5)-methyltransferase
LAARATLRREGFAARFGYVVGVTDAIVLEIDRMVAGGYGLARSANGTVLVRGALPDERVTARPALKAGVLRAHAIEILSPHPGRVRDGLPPGADLPLAYEDQLPVKEGVVREALARIAKLEHVLEPIARSPRALAYRTAAQYTVVVVVDGGGLGARAQDSNRIVPLSEDSLAGDPIAGAFRVCASRSLHGVEDVVFARACTKAVCSSV